MSKVLLLLFWLLFLMRAIPCRAGGVEMRNAMLNGVPVRPSERPPFPASSPLEVCFSKADYRYGGPAQEQEYLLLAILPEAPGSPSAAISSLPPNQIAIMNGRAAQGSEELNLMRCHRVTVPAHEGRYTIYSLVVPFFTNQMLVPPGTQDSTLASLTAEQRQPVLRHLSSYSSALYPLARFQATKAGDEPPEKSHATTLQLDGGTPTMGKSIKPGLAEKPAVITWTTVPKEPSIQYRFRTYPDETDWSPWGKLQEWKISFLPAGTHVFQVQPKYLDSKGHECILPFAYYQFFLEHPFVAAPAKGTDSSAPATAVPLQLTYTASEALVLGITQFQAFPELPYVSEDVEAMKTVLNKRGFHVTAPPTVTRRQAVLETVSSFLKQTPADSRVLIYLSTHGFVDPDIGSRNYLATSDCDPKLPVATCILVQELESTLLGLLEKQGIRHFLLLVDACASGIGVSTKSYAFPEAGTLRKGAHVITAGTADEEARASRDGKISVFTKYLVEGLEGKADTYPDGVITVSELLTYVRWNVANETGSSQTPMLGRLSGSGEMIFQLTPSH
jgi:Caspase domain